MQNEVGWPFSHRSPGSESASDPSITGAQPEFWSPGAGSKNIVSFKKQQWECHRRGKYPDGTLGTQLEKITMRTGIMERDQGQDPKCAKSSIIFSILAVYE